MPQDPISRAALETLGHAELRPGQHAAIRAVLDGGDCFAVLPTGAGKSAIYQLAGLLRDAGVTVVVSPLIALQADQLAHLQAAGLSAAALNSTLGTGAREEVLARLGDGTLQFLLLAPEQLGDEQLLGELAAARPGLFVVDEAHCVSTWGPDRRPDYLALGAVVDALGHPPTLALTATASPLVREEVAEHLGLREPRVVLGELDRPELHLAVERFREERTQRDRLLELVAGLAAPGIVYAATRRATEELGAALREAGVDAGEYHAGLRAGERRATAAAFLAGDLDVIVATSAFGMGVDKPDVRFVVHAHIPESVDAYWQEVGRAGRDGEPATATLLYRPEDLGLRRFFAAGGLKLEELEQVVEALRGGARLHDTKALARACGLSAARTLRTARRLAATGPWPPPGGLDGVIAKAVRVEERRKEVERSRIDMMRSYAELTSCRRRFLLGYFGEDAPRRCGGCDVCARGTPAPQEPAQAGPAAGERVRHARWGVGVVQQGDAEAVTVAFEEVGYKTLALEVLREHEELLVPVE